MLECPKNRLEIVFSALPSHNHIDRFIRVRLPLCSSITVQFESTTIEIDEQSSLPSARHKPIYSRCLRITQRPTVFIEYLLDFCSAQVSDLPVLLRLVVTVAVGQLQFPCFHCQQENHVARPEAVPFGANAVVDSAHIQKDFCTNVSRLVRSDLRLSDFYNSRVRDRDRHSRKSFKKCDIALSSWPRTHPLNGALHVLPDLIKCFRAL